MECRGDDFLDRLVGHIGVRADIHQQPHDEGVERLVDMVDALSLIHIGIDKLAMTSREALQTAMSTAADAQAGAVEPIHLLSALLGAGERNISVIIERIGADPAQLAPVSYTHLDVYKRQTRNRSMARY